MLANDTHGAVVEVKVDSVFPKGTIGRVVASAFIGNTTLRAYCVQTEDDIQGLVKGWKAEWFLERDLENVIEKQFRVEDHG